MKQSQSPQSILLRTTCALALIGLAAVPATAQSARPATVPPSSTAPTNVVEPLPAEGYRNIDATPTPNRETERFISKISMLHEEEARLSVIASQRATHEQVRTFAEQVRVSAQGREQEIAQLAQSRSVLIPTGKGPNDLAEENEDWQRKDADDFDEDYVERVMEIQKDAIDTLEDYAKDNDADPEIAAFAQKHLPILRENLRQAEGLEEQVD